MKAPVTVDEIIQAAESSGYKIDRTSTSVGIVSNICHEGGDNPRGVWVSENNGAPVVHCHKCGQVTEKILVKLGLLRTATTPATTSANCKWSEWKYSNPTTGEVAIAKRYDFYGTGECYFSNCTQSEPHKHVWTKRGSENQKGTSMDGFHVRVYKPEDARPDFDGAYFLPEGEKAADAIAAVGGFAASYIGGSKRAKHANYSLLKDKRVIVLPDNDEDGYAAAFDAASALRELGCNVVVADVVGEPGNGDDVADLSVSERIEYLTQCCALTDDAIQPDATPFSAATEDNAEERRKDKKERREQRKRADAEGFLTNRFGLLSQSYQNVELMLAKIEENKEGLYELRYNEWGQRSEIRVGDKWEFLSDEHITNVRRDLEVFATKYKIGNYTPPRTLVTEVLENLAHQTVVNTVKDNYVRLAKEWDGVERLDSVAGTYMHVDTAFANNAIQTLIEAMVLRVFHPGCRYPYALALHSDEKGVGKGSFLRELAGSGMHREVPLGKTFDARKDVYERAQGISIAEWTDFGGFGPKEMSENVFNGLVTAQEITARGAFERARAVKAWRIPFVWVLTTNNRNCVPKQRRFPIVTIPNQVISLEEFSEDRDQIVGEAAHRVINEQWRYYDPNCPDVPAVEMRREFWNNANLIVPEKQENNTKLYSAISTFIKDRQGILISELSEFVRAKGMKLTKAAGGIYADLGYEVIPKAGRGAERRLVLIGETSKKQELPIRECELCQVRGKVLNGKCYDCVDIAAD